MTALQTGKRKIQKRRQPSRFFRLSCFLSDRLTESRFKAGAEKLTEIGTKRITQNTERSAEMNVYVFCFSISRKMRFSETGYCGIIEYGKGGIFRVQHDRVWKSLCGG